MITRQSISYMRIWQLGGLILLDLAFFGNTNAAKVPSFAIIIGFILLVASFYWLFYGICDLAKLYGLRFKHKHRLSAYVAVVAGGLVALQSIGELSPRDVLVLLPLAVLGYFYSMYARTAGRDSRDLGS